MLEIVTDQKALREKSEEINDLDVGDVVQQLSITIPENALGLAAPQIGIHKRVFFANLSTGSYAFVNPQITWKSPDKFPSEEACLSLPGIVRCVERHRQVDITCGKLIDMKTGDLTVEPTPMRLKDRDASIVQHENDHLDGILILDLPETKTWQERRKDREKDRLKRVNAARKEVVGQKLSVDKFRKLSAKNIEKQKKEERRRKKKQRRANKRDRIRVEIQERYAAEKDGLFSDETSPASDASNEHK